jgi:hypothetical protein
MGVPCSAEEKERGVYTVLLGKAEVKRQQGSPRLRWENNIRMNLQKMRFGGMNWIGMAQNRDR